MTKSPLKTKTKTITKDSKKRKLKRMRREYMRKRRQGRSDVVLERNKETFLRKKEAIWQRRREREKQQKENELKERSSKDDCVSIIELEWKKWGQPE